MIFLNLFDTLRHLFEDPSEFFEPEKLIRFGGLLLLILITFAQTGLFFCFFIPGDAVLFTAGVLITTGDFHHNIIAVWASLILAAFAGNLTGYWIGRKAGPMLHVRKDGRFLKRHYLTSAEVFFQKYGKLAVTLGMFFIIIRTFAPVVAGITRLDFRRMAIYSFIGAAVWVSVLVLSGYFLGRLPFVEEYLEYVILLVLLGIAIPPLVKYLSSRKKRPRQSD